MWPRYARQRPASLLTVRRAVAFQQGHAIGWRRTIVRGQRKVRRALEHCQLRRLRGDQRDRLYPRRSRADHRHALASELDLLMRPAAGEIDLALEVPYAIDLRRLGRGETAGGHDVIAACDGRAIVGRELPAFGGLIPIRRRDLGAEADVTPQLIAVGDEAEVAQDFWLGRVFL